MSGAPLILDANLLVLLVVGLASKHYVARHKRLKQFSIDDFDRLIDIASAREIIVTPNTLTEASNLAGQTAEPARSHIFEMLGRLIASSEEKYVRSKQAVQGPEFLRLGLTDAALLTELPEAGELLTTDLELYLAALERGAAAYNFNHLRDIAR